MTYVAEPPPLEAVDPWLAEQFRQIANREHPSVRRIVLEMAGVTLYTRFGIKRIVRGRNDPCPCGSGKKLKKCCGR